MKKFDKKKLIFGLRGKMVILSKIRGKMVILPKM